MARRPSFALILLAPWVIGLIFPSAFGHVVFIGVLVLGTILFFRTHLWRVSPFRASWQAWSHDERYYQMRRFTFTVGNAGLIPLLIFALVFRLWFVSGVIVFTFLVGIVGLLRTPRRGR